MAEDEEATVRMVTAYRETVELLVAQDRGRLADFTGDNFLAEFATATDAVRCVLELQRVLAARNADLPPNRRLEFRMGIHLGEVRVEGERLFGTAVNVAARLEGLAEPGGVCVSAAIRDELRGKLAVECEDLGEHAVKNIPEPVRVYRLSIERTTEEPTRPRATTPQAGAGRSGAARRWVGGVVLALLMVAVLASWLTRIAPNARPIRSIAVLPLENLSGDPDQEFFADGMTEALIADLAGIGSLRVISRTSIMQYKGARKPLPEIAAELGVDGVLEGSVMRAGDRVRITTQLIDARSDEHLWAERYDRDLHEILALQSDVARAVAEQIRLELIPELETVVPPVVDPDAHDAYLKGRYLYARATHADSLKAVEYFQEAIRIDPDFALGYAGLADAYS
jgi:TolB-like protein